MTALAMITAAASRWGTRPAIEDADGVVTTYGELLARARAAATTRSGEVVAVPAARSVEFIAGCLGAWLAGAAWMPVDPRAPAARAAAVHARVHAAARADLAYVIATSGSTGSPKAVLVGHAGLPGLLTAQVEAFALGPEARALWVHAPLFDASLSDWGTVLASGGTLVLPAAAALASPARLRDELTDRSITHVDLPPSLLRFLSPTEPPPGLRVVVLGGEPCPVAEVQALARRLRVVVVYGPTEATVCSSLEVVDPERWARPRIGAPLPGITYDVVDGELWIAGACLALGYAGEPEATARAFVERGGQRWYRTGDRVEGSPDGLVFRGRLDRQRKLGGHRVELDDVEAVVRRAPGVREAAVVTRRVGRQERMIACCEGDVRAADVRGWLEAQLPAYLVPAQILVGALPRTTTGKVDRAALAAAPVVVAASAFVPVDEVEAELATLWRDTLGVEGAALDDRFRDRGGDSLAALGLHAALAACARPLAPELLASNPSLRELIAHVRAAPVERPLTVGECEERGRAARRPPPERGRARGDVVLVTGATGLLGSAVVQAWRRRGRPVIALVRAPDELAARRRLAGAGIEQADDVEVVCGDVAAPDLGLAPAAWARLRDRVSAVVHAAARIDVAGAWSAHAGANVRGTAEVVRLVEAAGAALHHVSTLSVFAATDRAAGTHTEACRAVSDACVHGGYAQTKVAAEALARAVEGRAVPTTIVRPGLLVSGRPRPGDQLAMTLRGLARLAAYPAGVERQELDLTPVPRAAEALVALALHAEAGGGDATYHLAAPHATRFGDLVEGLRAAGATVEPLAPAAWAARARAGLGDPDVAMAYLSLGRAHARGATASRLRPFDLVPATEATFATACTEALLAVLGVPAREACLDELIAGALRADGRTEEAGP